MPVANAASDRSEVLEIVRVRADGLNRMRENEKSDGEGQHDFDRKVRRDLDVARDASKQDVDRWVDW